MSTYVKKYVLECPQCTVNKTARKRLAGELQPITEQCSHAFEMVSFDMIVSLPWSNNYDAIMVVVAKLTKYALFIPTVSHFIAKSAADCFFDNVVSWGWLPVKFITDRDPRFVGLFWKHLCARLGIEHGKSTAYHAQTDGQTERVNQILEIALRAYTSLMQDDWVYHLPIMELAYNTARSVSTEFAPVELLYIQPHDLIWWLLSPDGIMDGANDSAVDFLDQARTHIEDAQDALRVAAKAQKRHYDN